MRPEQAEFTDVEGTLLADNTSGSATGSGDVIVGSTGTLGGAGSIDGTLTVNSGGILAPGASTDVLNVDDVDLNLGSKFAVELKSAGVAGTDFDQLVVDGPASLGGET